MTGCARARCWHWRVLALEGPHPPAWRHGRARAQANRATLGINRARFFASIAAPCAVSIAAPLETPHAQALHRQQELFVLVHAVLGPAEAGRHPVRGGDGPLRFVRRRFHIQATACRPQPGRPRARAGRRRLRGLGHAGHRRIPGREISGQAALAAARRRHAPARAASAPKCIRASRRCAATAR